MNDLSWVATVRLVHERANLRCEYCQTSQRVIGQAMHVEHIDPNGGDHPENLCLSCPACNLSKAQATIAPDPATDETATLFNPRTENWSSHFEWDMDGQILLGITPTGRATIARLKINIPRIVEARAIWVSAGVHPPK